MAEEYRVKAKKEEVLEVGRLLGAIAKVDPDVYEVIKSMAEQEGEKPITVLANIVKKYLLIQKVQQSSMTMEQLLAAIEIFRQIASMVTETYLSIAKMFFSEMTATIGEIIEQKVNERLEGRSEKGEKIRGRLIDIMLNMVEAIMTETMKVAYRSSGQQIPESLKLKIPVEVKVKNQEHL